MLESSSLTGTPARKTSAGLRLDWPGVASGTVLAAGTIAVYAGTLSVPFLFDDFGSIAENLSIRRLWPLWPVLSPPSDASVGGRPLLNLTYALNYASGGTAVWGFHLVNLCIHVLAGWILFSLVRRMLSSPILAKRFGSAATPLAFAVSAIWAWHPLQTEAVTYLSQRGESLMGLFYFLTLDCFLRGADTANRGARRIWFAASVLACLAGMATKEVMVTAPILVFIADRTFVSGSFAGAWRRHWPLYSALAATWLPLGFLMLGVHHRGVGFGLGATWWTYGLTGCHVMVRYLSLVFWPHPLVFDYGWYEPTQSSGVWPDALLLAALLVVTLIALRKAPATGFAACWFWLILAPTSSVVPLIGQPMAEHRLYLPLAGVVSLVVIGTFAMAGRWSLPGLAVIAVGLGVASAHRNRDYSSPLALWGDTVEKDPTNPRAHIHLGNAWAKLPGRLDDAVTQYQEALRLKPDYAEAHSNPGDAWARMPGRLNDAIGQYEEALRLKPDFAEAHDNLGAAWARTPGRLSDAISQYQEALRLKPDSAKAHYNLGNAWLAMPGRLDDAMAQFEAALRLKPDFADAHNNLGLALAQAGRPTEAVGEFRTALRLNPDYVDARRNLATMLQAPEP